jgi:hypothetical protein
LIGDGITFDCENCGKTHVIWIAPDFWMRDIGQSLDRRSINRRFDELEADLTILECHTKFHLVRAKNWVEDARKKTLDEKLGESLLVLF